MRHSLTRASQLLGPVNFDGGLESAAVGKARSLNVRALASDGSWTGSAAATAYCLDAKHIEL